MARLRGTAFQAEVRELHIPRAEDPGYRGIGFQPNGLDGFTNWKTDGTLQTGTLRWGDRWLTEV